VKFGEGREQEIKETQSKYMTPKKKRRKKLRRKGREVLLILL